MKAINTARLEKLEARLRNIAESITEHGDLAVHQAINPSYYMQKAEELRILKEELKHAELRLERMNHLICNHYADIYLNWRRDVRWLNQKQLSKRTIL